MFVEVKDELRLAKLDAEELDGWVTYERAAELGKCSEPTVRKAVRAGVIGTRGKGPGLRLLKLDVEKWRDSNPLYKRVLKTESTPKLPVAPPGLVIDSQEASRFLSLKPESIVSYTASGMLTQYETGFLVADLLRFIKDYDGEVRLRLVATRIETTAVVAIGWEVNGKWIVDVDNDRGELYERRSDPKTRRVVWPGENYDQKFRDFEPYLDPEMKLWLSNQELFKNAEEVRASLLSP